MNRHTLKYELLRAIRKSSTLDYDEALEVIRQISGPIERTVFIAERSKLVRQEALASSLTGQPLSFKEQRERNARQVQSEETT